MNKTHNELSPNDTAPRIAGLGEVLWDVYPTEETFGGAPANFACHCRALGADAAVVSAVGDDARGRGALRFLDERGVGTHGISILEGLPTGAVLVTLDSDGKPAYDIREGVAWDAIPWTATLDEMAASADAVCFGSLGQRSPASRETIQRFLRATRPGCLRVFDINLRQRYHSPELILLSLEAASVLKINDEELPALATQLKLAGSDDAQLRALVDRFSLRLAVLTRGPRGALMMSPEESSLASPPPVRIVSTVGAGDAFTASVVMGLLHNRPLDEINRRANEVAAYVCSQQGAVPPLPARLV
ncbi:MAG: carbohydrate kinase [Bryobacterales bacterium]|nr:carbohydrate kinase [Bryobacterales bacterium]